MVSIQDYRNGIDSGYEVNMAESIWITWERQRRSIELSRALKVKFYELRDISVRFLRYPYLSIKTLGILLKEMPKYVFAQNPSMILAALLCLLKKIFGFKLIVDRHSNFKFDKDPKAFKWRIFNSISNFTIKHADLTIVTNNYLRSLVDELGGRGFVLQDKLPELNMGRKISLQGKKNIVFISSFSDDEPLNQVIEAFSLLGKDWFLYITGRPKKAKNNYANMNPNIVLTGYLSDEDYQSLLISCDVVLVLTKQEHTLTCGAYECVYLRRPFVASSTGAIKEYFSKGVVYCDPDARSIAQAADDLFRNRHTLEKETTILRDELACDWKQRFDDLCKIVREL